MESPHGTKVQQSLPARRHARTRPRSLSVPAHGRAQETEPEEVVSPLVATPIASPNPVLGADDKVHLAYRHRTEKDRALDAGSGAVLGTMEGAGLAKMLRLNGGSKGTALPGGGPGPAYRRAASVHRW